MLERNPCAEENGGKCELALKKRGERRRICARSMRQREKRNESGETNRAANPDAIEMRDGESESARSKKRRVQRGERVEMTQARRDREQCRTHAAL